MQLRTPISNSAGFSSINTDYFIGARNTMTSQLAAHESVIRKLFTINPSTAEVSLRSGQKLDRESQSSYILVITADDTDSNVYGGCQYPPDTPWVHERSKPNEMELVITVEDINDSPPQFSQDIYTLAVVRGVSPPVTLTKLRVLSIPPASVPHFLL